MCTDKRFIIRLALALSATFFAAWIISTYFFQLALIEGDSMEPSYHNGQLVVLNRFSKEFERGDVVLFDCPQLNTTLLKRIVGCPGDLVHIADGSLYINGTQADSFGEIEYAGIAENELLIPERYYFALGDNVSKSKDSRYTIVGLISEEQLIGKVIVVH